MLWFRAIRAVSGCTYTRLTRKKWQLFTCHCSVLAEDSTELAAHGRPSLNTGHTIVQFRLPDMTVQYPCRLGPMPAIWPMSDAECWGRSLTTYP